LIGLAAGQEKSEVEVLNYSCRKRVEYVSTPLEDGPIHFPNLIPVKVGIAAIFVIIVSRCEEI
jgi:hypothetical protein